MTDLVTTFAEARARTRGTLALVPTMGYLHEGHLSLVERARPLGDTVMVSVFVNPLQFDDPSDLDRYPRDLEADARLVEGLGADLLFAPPLSEVYPAEPRTRVMVAEVTERMEGAHRPGHFAGVATVVVKLFAGLRPDRALFGRKDAQQLAVISVMTGDLGFPVEIVPSPTVREPDGLALSSRNIFLSPDERRRALGLSLGLFAAGDAVEAGERSARALEDVVHRRLDGVAVDYVELAAQADAARLEALDRPAFLAAAIRVGAIRLIDNVAFDLDAEGGFVVDRGRLLERPSILYRRAG